MRRGKLSTVYNPAQRRFPNNILHLCVLLSLAGKQIKDGSHVAKREQFKKYGDIYKEKLGNGTVVQLFDPDDAAKVYQEGGSWPQRPVLPVTAAACKRHKVSCGLSEM